MHLDVNNIEVIYNIVSPQHFNQPIMRCYKSLSTWDHQFIFFVAHSINVGDCLKSVVILAFCDSQLNISLNLIMCILMYIYEWDWSNEDRF